MQIGLSEIIAIISLMGSAIAFARTIRRRPEASWMNTYIVTTVPNATPPIDDGCGRKPRFAMLTNDGDGDGFDVRIFGHNCIIRAYEWEKLGGKQWRIGERTLIPRISNDGEDVKLAIWPPEGMDELPEDAEICVHWTKSPTRLRHCGYATIPAADMRDDWWNDKDWQTRHRIAERVRGWNAHRRFHRNPEDAIKAPKPDI